MIDCLDFSPQASALAPLLDGLADELSKVRFALVGCCRATGAAMIIIQVVPFL